MCQAAGHGAEFGEAFGVARATFGITGTAFAAAKQKAADGHDDHDAQSHTEQYVPERAHNADAKQFRGKRRFKAADAVMVHCSLLGVYDVPSCEHAR